ncbi:MAG: TonB-dependent receptor [Bacteroidia bacterium]|nr:TonB-dependent receptor [Bacteroidia bacterium]
MTSGTHTWKHYLGFLLLIVISASGYSQSKMSISGYLRDASSGEALVNATIAVPAFKSGTYSNQYGFYSLSITGDTVEVIFSYAGYLPVKKRIVVGRENIRLDISLEIASLEAVEITENLTRKNVEQASMGVIDVSIDQIEMMPYLAGEKDLLKGIQLLPGVQATSEASSGFLVRGGQPDQNLVLMDEAIVYNPFHLAGYVSIFNTDAIRDVTLYKGSFPAKYGGRLSSILDISMKEGNNQEFHAEGGLSVVSGRLAFEGPIVKNKASYMVSLRRFYWDQVIKPFLPFGRDLGYQFTDINAKVNVKLGDKDQLFLSTYYGGDGLVDGRLVPTVDTFKTEIKWGNTTSTLRWSHLFGTRLFVNTSVNYSDYLFRYEQFRSNPVRTRFGLQSGIRDWQFKTDFDFVPGPSHRLTFGANYLYHRFAPNSVRSVGSDTTAQPQPQVRNMYVQEGGVYINDEISLGSRLGLNLGFRYSAFYGDSTYYQGFEPRATIKWQFNESTSIKAGYTFMNQYSHLVSTSAVALPFDLWVPSSSVIKPQQAQQVAVGVFRNWLGDRYESSVEVYYKKMNNLIDYRQGANFFFGNDIEPELVFGEGTAYGAEFFLRKREGRFNGWIGYTLSWSWRQFDELNQGEPFFAKYDRRHDLELVAFYKFNKEWSFSFLFVYGTGNALSLPEGRQYIGGNGTSGSWSNAYNWGYDYNGKNNFRAPAYHRMDIGLHRHKKKGSKSKIETEFHIDIYNVYNRRNPLFIAPGLYLDERAGTFKNAAIQTSLLPMIPSVGYFFKF